MSSLYHRLSKDELIVLVETIEGDVEKKYKLMQAKCNILEELYLEKQAHGIYTCYSCGKFEMYKHPNMHLFSDTQTWIRIANFNPQEVIKLYGDSLVYVCDCTCGCRKRMCKQCCGLFNGNRNYTLCKDCVHHPNIDPDKDERPLVL